MKVAIVSTFYPYRGGISQFNAALYRALEVNHSVKAFNFSMQYPKLLFPGKTQYVSEEDNADAVPSKRLLNSINPFSYRSTYLAIKKYNPDVLIIGYWMPFMALSLGFISKRMANHSKVAAIVHNAIPHEKSGIDKVLSSYFFSRVSNVVALSDSVSKDVKKINPSINVKTLHHPAYQHFGQPVSKKEASRHLNFSSSPSYLLFFGLIRDYKGLDIVLKSMGQLNENIHLLVAGEVYGSFDSYQKLIKEHQLENRVHLTLDYIPDKEVKYYFSLAHSVVLPYKSGTQSGVIAIAKHFNVPIVVTDVGGLSEFIQDKSAGIVVPPNNVHAFTKGIKQVLKQVEDAPSSQEKSYQWSDFSTDLIDFII